MNVKDKRERSINARMLAARKNQHRVILESHLLLSLLTHVWPSHLAEAQTDRLAKPGAVCGIVCVHSPAGQLAWSLPEDQIAALFGHLSVKRCTWDGHGRKERQARLEALCVDAEAWPWSLKR